MSWWLDWLVLLLLLGILFPVWSWVPTERLDPYWRWNNSVGRPFLNTLVLTGCPALYAKLTTTPAAWLLVPICFALTQYAVLSGRVLHREMRTAGWVMIVTTAAIWLGFWLV